MNGTCRPPNNIICKSFLTTIDSNIIAFPRCQRIPSTSTSVTNPYYDASNNISYYTYKVGIQGCSTVMSFFTLLVCNTIPISNIRVTANIGVCNSEVELQVFDVEMAAPMGFKYIGINTEDLIIGGSMGIFIIQINGRYSEGTVLGDFIVTVDQQDYRVFDEWIVPTCSTGPKIVVNKDCLAVVENNSAHVDFNVQVSNTGDTDTNRVLFTDTITYPPGNTIIGNIFTIPNDIMVDASIPGIIRLRYEIDPIEPQGVFDLFYRVDIDDFLQGGSYLFRNIAIANDGEIQGSDSCEARIEVADISPDLICNILSDNRSQLIYRALNNMDSPTTEVNIKGTISIPTNITIEFISSNACVPIYESTNIPVEVGDYISGNRLLIDCTGVLSPMGMLDFIFNFDIISTSFDGGIIAATYDSLSVVREDQISIIDGLLPINSNISVSNDLICVNTNESRWSNEL